MKQVRRADVFHEANRLGHVEQVAGVEIVALTLRVRITIACDGVNLEVFTRGAHTRHTEEARRAGDEQSRHVGRSGKDRSRAAITRFSHTGHAMPRAGSSHRAPRAASGT